MKEIYERGRKKLYTGSYFLSLIPLKIFDKKHGTEFSGFQKQGKKEGYFEYFPSSMFSFPSIRRYVLRHMQSGKGHSVLDIGCGKGFVLLFFSSLGFDVTAGVEYDRTLYDLANKNLRKAHGPIKLFHMDALNFSGYADFDTFYLYNPFNETILEKCIDRILLSLEDNPRKLTVFYCNPLYGNCLIQRGFKEEAHFYYKTTVFVFDVGASHA